MKNEQTYTREQIRVLHPDATEMATADQQLLVADDDTQPILVAQESIIEKSLTEKPLTEMPLTEKPLTEKPLTEKSLNEKPLTEKPHETNESRSPMIATPTANYASARTTTTAHSRQFHYSRFAAPHGAIRGIITWMGHLLLKLAPDLLDARTHFLLNEFGWQKSRDYEFYTGLRALAPSALFTVMAWTTLVSGGTSIEAVLAMPMLAFAWILANYYLAVAVKQKRITALTGKTYVQRVIENFGERAAKAGLLLVVYASFVQLFICSLIANGALACYGTNEEEALPLLWSHMWLHASLDVLQFGPILALWKSPVYFFGLTALLPYIASFIHFCLNRHLPSKTRSAWAGFMLAGIIFPLPFASVLYLIWNTRSVPKAARVCLSGVFFCMTWLLAPSLFEVVTGTISNLVPTAQSLLPDKLLGTTVTGATIKGITHGLDYLAFASLLPFGAGYLFISNERPLSEINRPKEPAPKTGFRELFAKFLPGKDFISPDTDGPKSRIQPRACVLLIMATAAIFLIGQCRTDLWIKTNPPSKNQYTATAPKRLVFARMNLIKGEIIARPYLTERYVSESDYPAKGCSNAESLVGQVAARDIPSDSFIATNAVESVEASVAEAKAASISERQHSMPERLYRAFGFTWK